MNWAGKEIDAIILDRDGVINRETGNFVKNLDEWRALAGSLNAISRLSQSGYPVFVATNQSGIARGLYTEQTLRKIHQHMLDQVHDAGGEIKDIVYCPHIDSDGCDCRKPKSGLLRQISRRHNIELRRSVMVGDSIRDLQAGLNAGARAVLVSKDSELIGSLKTGYDTPVRKVPVYADLAEFAEAFLKQDRESP